MSVSSPKPFACLDHEAIQGDSWGPYVVDVQHEDSSFDWTGVTSKFQGRKAPGDPTLFQKTPLVTDLGNGRVTLSLHLLPSETNGLSGNVKYDVELTVPSTPEPIVRTVVVGAFLFHEDISE